MRASRKNPPPLAVTASPTPRKPARRAARTRDRLGDALIALMLEKSFEDITVGEVLTRAGMSRSTFYAHFRDKNDLFLSDVDDFFGMMSTLLQRRGDRSDRVAPVAELFAHVAESRAFVAALVDAGRMGDVKELGEAHFAVGIAARLAHGPRAIPEKDRAALAHALAGALWSLLIWGLRQGTAVTPQGLDALFHSLIPGPAMPIPVVPPRERQTVSQGR